MLCYVLFILLFQTYTSIAAFTKPARWPNSNLIIQKNSAGAWCFLPVSGETTALSCKGSQADLQGTLDAHMHQNLSIAYYNAIDNVQRGGATWSLPTTGEIIRLCASGKGGDGVIQTICLNVAADDTFYGTPYCEVAIGPRVVSDGCYVDTTTTSTFIPPSPPKSSSTTTAATSTSTATLTATSFDTATSTRSSMSQSTSTITSQAYPSSITIDITRTTNWAVDVFVPILGAILGVVAAAIGAKLWEVIGHRRTLALRTAGSGGLAAPS